MPNTFKSTLLAAMVVTAFNIDSTPALAQMGCENADMMTGMHDRHMRRMEMGGMGMSNMGMGIWPDHPTKMREKYVANKDGRVDQQELDAARTQGLQQFDADKNTRLSLEEYKALWLKENQLRIVREFQHFDVDGDAQLTLEEYKTQIPPAAHSMGGREGSVQRGTCGMMKRNRDGDRADSGDRGGYDDRSGMHGKRYHDRMDRQRNRNSNTQSSTMKENQEQLPTAGESPLGGTPPAAEIMPQP